MTTALLNDLPKLEVRSDVRLNLMRGPISPAMADSLRNALALMHTEANILGTSQEAYIAHTWEDIINCAKGLGDLWLATTNHSIRGFLVATYGKDVENEWTYVIRQAWVDPSLRRTPKVKEMLRTILSYAKGNYCRHVLIVSSRNEKAYLRWLGKGWFKVTTILQGEL